MSCAAEAHVALPLVQVLMIAGAVIGGAIIASWRETVTVARHLAAANVVIGELRRRLDAIETSSRKDT